MRYYVGGYYPTDTMRGLDLTDPEWGVRMSEYATAVLNESLPIYYQSEKPDLSDRDGLITRLVGSTFQEFVENNTTDTVVLFYAATEPENISSEFEEAVTAVYKGGTTSIKFAHINIWRNACRRRFPSLISNPLVVMFPANNASVTIPYLGALEKVSLLRFFKARASLANRIEVAPVTVEQAKAAKTIIEEGISVLPDWATQYANEEIYSLELVINASVPATAEKAASPKATASPTLTATTKTHQ
jgi:hypothetical protein